MEKINLFEGNADVMPPVTRTSSTKNPETRPVASGNTLSTMYDMVCQADANMAEEFKRRDDELAMYTGLAENPKDIHEEVGRINLFAKLSFGLRKAGEAHAWALVHKKLAASAKKEAEAIAALDEFGSWLRERRVKEKDFKATADMRKSYTYLSGTVKAASRYEAVSEGMTAHFGTLHHQLSQSISTLRALIYGPKDSTKMGWQPGTGSE